ncbi:hypothetical protein VTK73DRAFT_5922 [Phialemonium thermophilum]|uniref:Uncharacterized protein n=1 Tax=Phialemonium thermophilum TaxID=223376 RepID=A0ABR3V0F0_9PEZI
MYHDDAPPSYDEAMAEMMTGPVVPDGSSRPAYSGVTNENAPSTIPEKRSRYQEGGGGGCQEDRSKDEEKRISATEFSRAGVTQFIVDLLFTVRLSGM